MQGVTCLCILLVLLLATMGVQGVSHDKLASSRVNKLRARLSTTEKTKKPVTIATSARTQKRGSVSVAAAPTTLLQQKQSTKITTKDTPTDSTVEMDAWATSPTNVIATPLTEPTSELKDDASVSEILQAYNDVEKRVDHLEEGRRDAVWNRADIASAQDQAVRIIQSAQDSVANEQAKAAAMSTLEVSAKKEETKQTTDKAETDASTDAAATRTEVEEEEDPACCTDAHDAVARAGNVANSQSIADMQAQVQHLTEQITEAIAPPSPTPTELEQQNAAVVADSGTNGEDSTGGNTPRAPTSTGSAAECNANLNKDTMKGDPDIWKEVAQAKKDALDKLMAKVEPQFTTGMATDDATLTKTEDLMVTNDAKSKDFKNELAKTCAEPTCPLGEDGGLKVEADTS